jgi:peptide-methionine (S)-S-oxide reductase
MRQHGDIGTQYRSAIYVLDSAQRAAAEASLSAYPEKLTAAHRGTITSEIVQAGEYFYGGSITGSIWRRIRRGIAG